MASKWIEAQVLWETRMLWETQILKEKGIVMTRTGRNHITTVAALAVIAVLAVGNVLSVGNTALAVPVGALATSPDALNTDGPDAGFWRGSQEMVGSQLTFSGQADFAVFGPGSFQSFLDATYGGGAHSDPTGGSEYIYAFQFRSDSGEPIQTLNAGYDLGADLGSLGAPTGAAGSGDTAPNSTAFNSTSARWDWGFGDSVANGQTSDVLFYSSNRPPQPDFVTLGAKFLLDQADSDLPNFASPSIPEPASLISMMIALVSMGLVAGRRNRK
jgi:hypothetical protein